MLPYIKFAEDKVLVFVIIRQKCENSTTVSLTLILTLISRAIDKITFSRFRLPLFVFLYCTYVLVL